MLTAQLSIAFQMKEEINFQLLETAQYLITKYQMESTQS